MQLPTQAELLAFGRNVLSGVGPVLALAVTFGALTPDQQHQVTVSLGHIVAGIKEAWIGLAGLGFLVPLVSGWFAKLSSSPDKQVQNAAKAIDSGKLKGVAILPTEDESPVSGASGDLDKAAVLLAAATQKP